MNNLRQLIKFHGVKELLFLILEYCSCKTYSFYKKWRLGYCGSGFSVQFPMKICGGNNIRIGSNFSSIGNCFLYANDGEIYIGDNLHLNINVFIGASNGKIHIGHNVTIGPNTVLRAADHLFKRSNVINTQGHKRGFILIQNDVWIGSNVVILKDVTLKEGTVVAAGAVVTSDTEPYSIYAGVPAKKISERI